MGSIKQKMGYCGECGNTEPKPIIGGYCNFHYWQSRKKPIERKPVKIKPVSDKKAKELAKYRIERDIHFKDYPICQFPNCDSKHIQLHHGAGRIGSLLWNRKYFKSLCDKHHKYVEANPIRAKEMGLSFERINK